jgi:exosome complex component MTR3
MPASADVPSYRPLRRAAADSSAVSSARGARDPRMFRSMHAKVGVVSRAVGSAYIESGGTKIICAVYGPRQTERALYSEQGRIRCDVRYTSSTTPEPERHKRTTEEKEPSQQMQRALEVCVRLEKYPKSVIDIFVTVLDSDGGVLPLAITCGSLALAHAGIEMFDLVAACSVASIDRQILLDPTEEEEARAHRSATRRCDADCSVGGIVMMATMPALARVTQLVQIGEIDSEISTEMIARCEEGCRHLLRDLRQTLCAT